MYCDKMSLREKKKMAENEQKKQEDKQKNRRIIKF